MLPQLRGRKSIGESRRDPCDIKVVKYGFTLIEEVVHQRDFIFIGSVIWPSLVSMRCVNKLRIFGKLQRFLLYIYRGGLVHRVDIKQSYVCHGK